MTLSSLIVVVDSIYGAEYEWTGKTLGLSGGRGEMVESRQVICGVDPGRFGGIAFLGKKPSVVAMPAYTGHDYRLNDILLLLGSQRATTKPDLLVIERVTRPAALTRCMGIFEGMGVALGYRVETVRPQEWKRHFGLVGGDKGQSMKLARQRFPHLAHEFKRVTRDDGKAEALLLALFAKETGL